MKNIKLCDDGVYRWSYEFSMLKNPMIIITILKIFGGIAAGLWVFLNLINLFEGNLNAKSLADSGKGVLITLAILVVMSVLAYLIVASIYGWKYCVLFEMSENGIRHIQMPRQFEKAQALAWLEVMVGAAGGKPGVAGAGLLSGARNELATEFSKVKKMKVKKKFNTIKLDSPLNHNQIYAEAEDFDFVLNFISERVNVKKK